MSDILNNKKGLTLVEIIVSIAILVIIVTPLSNMFLTAFKINKDSEDLMMAANNAQQVVEQKMAGISFPDNIMDDFDFKVTNPADYDDYKMSEEELDYQGIIELEKENENEARVVYSDNTENYISNVDGETFEININSSLQIQVVGEPSHSMLITDSDPVKLGVICYGDANVELEVSNDLPETEDIYIYIAKVKDEEYQSTSDITVTELSGEVKVREIENLQKIDDDSTEQLLKQLNIKVSKGSTYSEDDKLIDITILKKE